MPDVLSIALMSLVVELALVLFACGGARLAPGPTAERLGWLPGRLRARGLALLVTGTLGLSHALDSAAELLGMREGSALAGFDALAGGATGIAFAALLVGIGLAPAFGEELLCRGLVQRGATRHWGALPGIAAGALLFALLHLDPVHAVLAFPLGLYLGCAAHLDGGVRAAILCHAVNNCLAVWMAARGLAPTPEGLPGLVLGLALAGAAAAAAARSRARRGPARALQPGPGSVDP